LAARWPEMWAGGALATGLGAASGGARSSEGAALIKDHFSEIEQFGCARRCAARMDVAMPCGDVKRTEVEEFWLNEEQALLVAVLSKGPPAVRRHDPRQRVRASLRSTVLAAPLGVRTTALWHFASVPGTDREGPLRVDMTRSPSHRRMAGILRLRDGWCRRIADIAHRAVSVARGREADVGPRCRHTKSCQFIRTQRRIHDEVLCHRSVRRAAIENYKWRVACLPMPKTSKQCGSRQMIQLKRKIQCPCQFVGIPFEAVICADLPF
jgi:hypothetical protein